jgi:hypothetical protein
MICVAHYRLLIPLLLALAQLLPACGNGGSAADAAMVAVAAGTTTVRYDGNTLVVKGVSFGPQKVTEYCAQGAHATPNCYQPRRVGIWVRKSSSSAVDQEVLLFGLRVVERLVYECAGSDREFWLVDVPGGFELQWLLALRLFLTIVSALVLPAPIAPSDPFNDPAQVVWLICQFARAAG